MKRRRGCLSWCTRVALTAGIALAGWAAGGLQPLRTQAEDEPPGSPEVVTVMAVGGSSAHGWDDPNRQSYLKRAFEAFDAASRLQLDYEDETIPGAPAASISTGKFAQWLAADRPDVVALSWGLLDDVANHTPIPVFTSTLRDEIEQSLNAHAVVMVITPPVVTASAGRLHEDFAAYASAEYELVTSLHNPNVYWFDLHEQTLDYIQGHHQDVSQYCANAWHPNESGHELGGQLLAEDWMETFGSRADPFRFVSWIHGARVRASRHKHMHAITPHTPRHTAPALPGKRPAGPQAGKQVRPAAGRPPATGADGQPAQGPGGLA
ncbi:MAG: SGNH/GDSL hydrolase family protein [Alicyclobacillus sp.]|nr:SGNH/GDSL hydrolase family protein [Alicyclobacillus sp.]